MESNEKKEVNKIDIQAAIKQSKRRFKQILKSLKWNEKNTAKNFHSNSKTPRESPITTTEFHPSQNSINSTNSIVISQDLLGSIVSDNNAINSQREQKLRIYEYVLEHTQALVPAVVLDDDNAEFAEIVAAKKAEKKEKRHKYRTSKPTRNEEVRNLIELQMQALKQKLSYKTQLKEEQEYRNNEEKQNSRRGHIPTKTPRFSRTRSSPIKHARKRCNSSISDTTIRSNNSRKTNNSTDKVRISSSKSNRTEDQKKGKINCNKNNHELRTTLSWNSAYPKSSYEDRD